MLKMSEQKRIQKKNRLKLYPPAIAGGTFFALIVIDEVDRKYKNNADYAATVIWLFFINPKIRRIIIKKG